MGKRAKEIDCRTLPNTLPTEHHLLRPRELSVSPSDSGFQFTGTESTFLPFEWIGEIRLIIPHNIRGSGA